MVDRLWRVLDGPLAGLVPWIVLAVGSMLAGVPFTIQYAREQVAEEYWQTPLFVRVNYVITGAWALAFLVAAVAGFYGDTVLRESDNVWTGWVIQTAAMVGAIRFTGWYPDFARAKATAVEAN